MSVLAGVLRELETGADTVTVARRLGISTDLAAAAIEHWVDVGRAVRPERTTALPAQAEPGAAGDRGDGPASAACVGCEPRPRWRTALSCYGCPFSAPR